MRYRFVWFEVGSVLQVETSAIYVTNYAEPSQRLSLFGFLSLSQNETIDYHSIQNCQHHQMDYNYIQILEYREDSNRNKGSLLKILLKEIPHKSIDRFEPCSKYKNKAVTEGITVMVRIIYKKEEEQDTEEVLDYYVCNDD